MQPHLLTILSSKLPALLREREHVCVHASELNVNVLGNKVGIVSPLQYG
jgi:hypothetical protein